MELMGMPMFLWMLVNVVGFIAFVIVFVVDKSWWTAETFYSTLKSIIAWIISCTLWGMVWILSY